MEMSPYVSQEDLTDSRLPHSKHRSDLALAQPLFVVELVGGEDIRLGKCAATQAGDASMPDILGRCYPFEILNRIVPFLLAIFVIHF